MTLIVASLVERSIAGASRSSQTAFDSGADVVEVRLDHLDRQALHADALSELRGAIHGPAVATLRSTSEGGLSSLGREERSAALADVLASGFDYVDLELEADWELLQSIKGNTDGPRAIASSHFKEPVPMAAVAERLLSACDAGDIGKVAMPCENGLQALGLARVGMEFSREGRKFALMGMGDQGRVTRACARTIGSRFVYCCLPGREAAPGQLDLATQRAVMEEDAVLLGLLGHPVSHSVSRPMHEAALAKAGMAGMYIPLDIPPGGVDAETMSILGALGFRGVNVTIPHKLAALRTCSSLDPSASVTGAVNTLRFSDDEINGENTDVIGFERLIEGKIHITETTRILVVGAGGAARAVVHVLSGMGGRLTISSRRPAAAEELAVMFGGEGIGDAHLAAAGVEYDIVVNCTPVGMKGGPEGCPVPREAFKEGGVFLDLVYNPETTRAMEAARSRGAAAFNGLAMLVGQGARSFEAWTGVRPDTEVMTEAARRTLA
jgi:shikimate dehydrogenase